MGLGLTGQSTAAFLLARGAFPVASEAKPEADLASVVSDLRRSGGIVECGGHTSSIFDGCEIVVVSPGVPLSHPAILRARSAGARVVSEIELASWYLKGRIVGITGSNGKSTVTALTAAILSEAGMKARPCGNIGLPLIAMTAPAGGAAHVKDLGRSQPTGGDSPDAVYVVEISSFQLEAIETFRPSSAALLNLSPDHMDRYDRVEDYYAAKARLFSNQKHQDLAVLNADDPPTWALAPQIRARLVPFSLRGVTRSGVVLKEGRIVHVDRGAETFLMNVSEVPLPGRHNLENAAAAAAVTFSFGAPAEAIRRAVASFEALPHRLRFVREVRAAAVYDDSKATNVGSAIRAVEAFDAPVILLLGGRDKGGDFASLAPRLGGKVRAVVTFGEAGPLIADRLEGAVPLIRSGALREAARAAIEAARPGDVVLLAPACASFDAYTSYAARGDDFVRAVHEIAAALERN